MALDTVRERLTHLREHRIETNDEIRNLVAHEKRLSRMVRISQEPSHVDEAGDE